MPQVHQANQSQAPRVKVTFQNQALRNRQVIDELDKIPNMFGAKALLMMMEMDVTARRLAEDNKVDITQPVAFEYDPNCYKRSMDGYLNLQTEAIARFLDQQEHMGNLPGNLKDRKDEFNLAKIEIGKYRQPFFSGLGRFLSTPQTDKDRAVDEIAQEVAEAQKTPVNRCVTAIFGHGPLFF
jgi:hypothetical protein